MFCNRTWPLGVNGRTAGNGIINVCECTMIYWQQRQQWPGGGWDMPHSDSVFNHYATLFDVCSGWGEWAGLDSDHATEYWELVPFDWGWPLWFDCVFCTGNWFPLDGFHLISDYHLRLWEANYHLLKSTSQPNWI